MSDEKQETMDDIVREMRNLGKLDEKSTDKIPRSLMGLGLRTYADRLEAAWKRESTQKSENCVVGNAAAMREAANATIEAIKKTDLCDYVGFETERCKGCDYYLICEAVDRLRQALSAPLRAT